MGGETLEKFHSISSSPLSRLRGYGKVQRVGDGQIGGEKGRLIEVRGGGPGSGEVKTQVMCGERIIKEEAVGVLVLGLIDKGG